MDSDHCNQELPTGARRRRFHKWILFSALFAIVAALATTFFLLPRLDFLRAAPEKVLQNTLELANEGRYEDATNNLSEGNRTAFQKNPKLMKEAWDLVTRDQTIAEVSIPPVGRFDDVGRLTFTIRYKDGTEFESEEFFKLEAGVWKHTIARTFTAMRLKE